MIKPYPILLSQPCKRLVADLEAVFFLQKRFGGRQLKINQSFSFSYPGNSLHIKVRIQSIFEPLPPRDPILKISLQKIRVVPSQ